MVATSVTSPLSVKVQDRTFPLSFRAAAVPTDLGSESTNPTESARNLLLGRLEFHKRPASQFSNVEGIVRAFCKDVALLETMASQWRSFLKRLKASQLDAKVYQDVPKKQRAAALADVMQRMGHQSARLIDDVNVLTGTLLTKPIQVVYSELQVVFREVTHKFANGLRSDLEQLSDVRVVGLIDWASKDVCKFHFFEHRLRVVSGKKRTETSRRVVETADGWARELKVLKKLSGKSIHSVTRIEEHLMGAQAYPHDAAPLPNPERIKALIKSVPDWLKPELAIVEGEKFREDRVLLTRYQKQWSVTEVETRIEPHFDPAVTLFNEFVLAGWDHREHEREIRNSINATNTRLESDAEVREQESAVAADRSAKAGQLILTSGLLCLAIVAAFSVGRFTGLLVMAGSCFALGAAQRQLATLASTTARANQVLSYSWLLALWAASALLVAYLGGQQVFATIGMSFALLAGGSLPLVWLLQQGSIQMEDQR
ncbi:MAG: hypothetical protein AB8G99_02580 [Planctomycetaceae bacterium]